MGVPCSPYIPAELAPRVGWIVARTANQSIPNATVTDVTWPTESQDTDTFFTPGGAPATIPSGKAGLYAITFTLTLSASSAGAEFGRIIAGGKTYDFAAASTSLQQSGGIVVPLAVGNTVSIATYQASGGALDLNPGTFMGFLIGQ